jgi:hypothetical protein
MDYNPCLIKITNSLLFVQTVNKRCLFINELNCLSLKQKIGNPAEYCRLSVINSNVYRYNSQSKSFLFYDENGWMDVLRWMFLAILQLISH